MSSQEQVLAPATPIPDRIFAVSAIAFDLDGTLLDTVHDLGGAVNAMLAELHHPPLPIDAIRTMIGKGMPELVRRALARVRHVTPDALTDAEIEFALASYQAHYGRRLGQATLAYPGCTRASSDSRRWAFRSRS